MKISIVTIKDDFIKFLETKTAGMSLVNRYTTLSNERELNKFKDDFNHVDSFVFIDFQDLSREFKEFIDYLTREKSYFLVAGEILIITHKDEALSPTDNLNKNLEAIEAYMEQFNLKLRIVRLEKLRFMDIYKSLTSSDSIADSQPKKLLKYKVMHTEEGIVIPPKKSKDTIVPDSIKGNGSKSKSEDLKSSVHFEQTVVKAPTIIEHARVEKDFKDNLHLSLVDSTVVFISGIRYSGKTTLALMCAKELEEQGINSMIVDLTGRKDLVLNNKGVKSTLGLVKGLDFESKLTSPVLGFQVYSKVRTTTFLTELIKDATSNRIITFCEVDPDQIKEIYTSFRGNKVALVPMINTLISIRDSIELANHLDFPIVPVVSNIIKTEDDINQQHLADTLTNCRAVFNSENLVDLVSNLIR